MTAPSLRMGRMALGLLVLVASTAQSATAQERSWDEGRAEQEDLAATKAWFSDPFLSRYKVTYQNYGWIDYETYRAAIPIFRRYDAFGNYLTEGYEVFRMEETRAAPATERGSVLLKGRFYQNWLRHLVIADDAYGGWSSRVTVGDAIRTTFTPLTLDMARFNGVRWDEASPENRFSLVMSRLSDPVKLDLKNQLGPAGKREQVNDGLYLMGGHWESRVGDFLVFGASYLNLHRFDSTRGFNTNTRKGLAPPFTRPTQLVVRFQDDSSEDGVAGAVVFDVRAAARVVTAGEERVQEITPSSVVPSEGVVSQPGYLEASGVFVASDGFRRPVYIDYVFTVPDSTSGVTFTALVANDYRILIRQDHVFDDPDRGRSETRSTPFTVIRRAQGNVVDLSNRRQLVFEHGMETGMELVGMDASVRAGGFEIRGEAARSTNYLQYASREGRRSEFDDMAAYATARREIGRFALSLEGFRIGPRFTTYETESIARQNALGSPNLRRDGVGMSITDPRTLGVTYFFNEARQDPVGTDATEGGNKTFTPIYALVDDNDDMDQWPDDWLQDWDVANREIKYLESDAGIYPFFDFDADGFPDNNRNRNQFADSDEPFLMYFTDPKEFYFGDDFNNNFALDIWEDDDQPNYPYTKDQQGSHGVITARLWEGVTASLGRYDVAQVSGGGHNEVTYGKLTVRTRQDRRWWLRLNHESKIVEDDIPDPVFDFRVEELSDGRLSPGQILVPDPVSARDSFVNRGLVQVNYRRGPALNLNAKLRYELNAMGRLVREGAVLQEEDDLDFTGVLAKGDYTRHFGRLAVMPRAKVQYRSHELASLEEAFVEDLMFGPILRLDYRLTERSQVRIGFQGFPLLADRRIDLRDHDNDSRQQATVVSWYNQSQYEGYRIGTEAGAEYRAVDYDVKGRNDASYVRYFVRMVAGVGTLSD